MIVLSELSESNKYGLLKFLKENMNSFSDPSYFNPHPFTLDAINEILVNRKKDIYILFTQDAVVVGYGMLRGMDEGYEIPSLGIMVDRNYRGKGIGRFIMLVLHDIAKSKGYTKIRLTLHKENTVAKNLYSSLGYVFSELDEHGLVGTLDLKEYS